MQPPRPSAPQSLPAPGRPRLSPSSLPLQGYGRLCYLVPESQGAQAGAQAPGSQPGPAGPVAGHAQPAQVSPGGLRGGVARGEWAALHRGDLSPHFHSPARALSAPCRGWARARPPCAGTTPSTRPPACTASPVRSGVGEGLRWPPALRRGCAFPSGRAGSPIQVPQAGAPGAATESLCAGLRSPNPCLPTFFFSPAMDGVPFTLHPRFEGKGCGPLVSPTWREGAWGGNQGDGMGGRAARRAGVSWGLWCA